MVLHHIDGFDEKLKKAITQSTALFEMINKIPGLKVSPVKNGTNIFKLEMDAKIDSAKLSKTMREKHNIILGQRRQNDPIRLMVNETLLLRDNNSIVEALKDSIKVAS